MMQAWRVFFKIGKASMNAEGPGSFDNRNQARRRYDFFHLPDGGRFAEGYET